MKKRTLVSGEGDFSGAERRARFSRALLVRVLVSYVRFLGSKMQSRESLEMRFSLKSLPQQACYLLEALNAFTPWAAVFYNTSDLSGPTGCASFE